MAVLPWREPTQTQVRARAVIVAPATSARCGAVQGIDGCAGAAPIGHLLPVMLAGG